MLIENYFFNPFFHKSTFLVHKESIHIFQHINKLSHNYGSIYINDSSYAMIYRKYG